MKDIKEICVITNKYPNELEPNALVFLQQLVWSFSDCGIVCNVICPVPVNINPAYLRLPKESEEKTSKDNKIKLYFPRYIGFGQTNYGPINPARITTYFFTKAVEQVIKVAKIRADVLYGHFITPAGIAVSRIGAKYSIPCFMAYGEATLMTINHFGGVERVARELKSLNGVVAVSTRNKHVLVDLSIVDSSKVHVFPNAYRSDRFRKIDKYEARKQLGLPSSLFIAAFVGSFDERKGMPQLLKAARLLGTKIGIICAGKGPITPDVENCLFSGPVHHDELSWFYNAADVFVLPTQNEGMSNAIIEAMACGLPIISSDLPFNDDILDDSNSIRIDPNDVDALISAITTLRDNPELRARLAQGSLNKAKNLTLDARARNIMSFIQTMSRKAKSYEKAV